MKAKAEKGSSAMESLILVVFLYLIMSKMLGGNLSNTQVRQLTIAIREVEVFISYCEKHREDLPPHVQERFAEMEENLKKLKDDLK